MRDKPALKFVYVWRPANRYQGSSLKGPYSALVAEPTP